jgi:hypothetical protein
MRVFRTLVRGDWVVILIESESVEISDVWLTHLRTYPASDRLFSGALDAVAIRAKWLAAFGAFALTRGVRLRGMQ